MIIKNIDSKTPLDKCQNTIKDAIASLVSEYNHKRGEIFNNNYVALHVREQTITKYEVKLMEYNMFQRSDAFVLQSPKR